MKATPLPQSVRINHFLWTVEWMDAQTAEIGKCYGAFIPGALLIRVQENLPPALTADTVLHECIHALLFTYGVTLNNREDAEETLTLWLPGALARLWMDNPQLEDWWKENRA